MLPQRAASAIVPSRSALRVLRHLALAGSTLGGICAIAALTYDTHRRANIAEKLVKNKRTIQTSTPYYNATSAAKKLALMVEAAEAGEYDGLASLKEGGWNRAPNMRGENAHPKNRVSYTIAKPDPEPESDSPPDKPPPRIARFRLDRHLDYSDTFTHRDLERAVNDLQRAATTKAWLADRSKAIAFSTYDQTTSETPVPLEQWPSDDLEAREGTTRTIRDLFQRGRIVEAAELFLESRSENNESLSSSDLELVVNIFYANCADDNVWVARNLFEHVEALGSISPRMWQALLIALAKANAVDSASQLILKYMERIDIPYYMAELVICCLIETLRFSEASAVFYKNLQTDRSCALSNVYLETLWKKTRNIEAVKRDLDKILAMLGRFRIPPTAKIFNPLLKAYIYFGRYSDAAALYNDMTTLYGVTPTCRSRGLLLLGDAFCCNWKEVKEGLQEMHELGMTSDQKSFVPAFTSLFLEYWPTHNAAEIREFFMEAVEKYLLQPDQYLFEHVLDAYIQKGNPEMVAELTRLAEKLQWKVSMNEDEFMGKIQINRRRVHNSPAGFWQLLNAARSLYGQAAASRQILGYDHQTLPWPEANCLPDAKSFPSWYRRALQSRMTAKPLDKYANLHLSMADAIRNGDFKSALSFYKNALQSCYEFATYHVELAAIARLLNDGLVPAQELIRAQWGKLQEKLVILPQFFHQVTECDDSSLSGVECVKLAVFRFYGLCLEYPKLQLTHNLTNHVAMEYISQDRPDLALDLLITAYKSRWGRQLALGAACMRTMLRAFVLADHLKGVRWCILTAMARESACDKDFVAEARRALITGHLRRKKGNYGYKKRVELLDHLGRLVSLLERKHAGDPELAQLLTNKVHVKEARRRSGKTYFPKVGKWHDDAHEHIGKTVAYWDEERELEWAIEPPTSILLGKDKTMALWNENRVVAEAEIAC